jgi:protease-4
LSTPENEPSWERQLLEKVAFAALHEQRAKRRWGIFFKLAGLTYLIAVLVLVVDWGGSEQIADGRHTAVIHLHGTIEAQGEASAQNINDALEAAFADKGTAGRHPAGQQPGWQPGAGGIVHDEIRRLRTKHPQIPLYAVVEDLCASGGYYVAVAADKIFVDKASIVGSIGVLMDGFGFTGTMDKLGVERRLLTAGENKGFLDPFSPQDAKQKEHAQVLLREIHKQFIEVVRRGRGTRLKETPKCSVA